MQLSGLLHHHLRQGPLKRTKGGAAATAAAAVKGIECVEVPTPQPGVSEEVCLTVDDLEAAESESESGSGSGSGSGADKS